MWELGPESSVSNVLYVPRLPAPSLPCWSLYCSPSCCGTLRQRQPGACPSAVYSWLLPLLEPPLFHLHWLISILWLLAGRIEVLLLPWRQPKAAWSPFNFLSCRWVLTSQGCVNPVRLCPSLNPVVSGQEGWCTASSVALNLVVTGVPFIH